MARKQNDRKPSKKTAKGPKVDAAAPATWPASKATKSRDRDPRLPAAGTTLTRTYKGRDYKVAVLEDGFRFEGAEFRSLSALASRISGAASINGFLWFGLTKADATPKTAAAERAVERAKTRAPKAKRAGRDPEEAAATEAAPEIAPPAGAAMA